MVAVRSDWIVRELDAGRDVGAVASLSLACADYALLVNGEPPNPDDGAGFFADVAPGRTAGDMLKLGVLSAGGALVGVADVVRSYPSEDDWYIGLLLLHPATRRQGAGRAAADWIDLTAGRAGASRLVLSVVEENGAALAFWRRLGFSEVGRLKPRLFGRRMHARVELQRPVGSGHIQNARAAASAMPER